MQVVRSLEVPPGWDVSKNGVSPPSCCSPACRAGTMRGRPIAAADPPCPATLPLCPRPRPQDSDHTALLCRETVQGGHSVLVFCGTKQLCEVTAKRAARWAGGKDAKLLL